MSRDEKAMRVRALPRAVRLMLWHGAIGFLVGLIFVSGLIVLDGGGVGALLWRVGGIEAIALLWFFSGLTFGSALMGCAVMSLGECGERPASGSRMRAALRPMPLRVARRQTDTN